MGWGWRTGGEEDALGGVEGRDHAEHKALGHGADEEQDVIPARKQPRAGIWLSDARQPQRGRSGGGGWAGHRGTILAFSLQQKMAIIVPKPTAQLT